MVRICVELRTVLHCLYVYVFISINMYIYIYINTHTHIHILIIVIIIDTHIITLISAELFYIQSIFLACRYRNDVCIYEYIDVDINADMNISIYRDS